MKIGTCDNLVQQNWILPAIVEYDMHCMYITSNDMLPRKLKDLIGDQAEEVNSVITSSSVVSCIYPSHCYYYANQLDLPWESNHYGSEDAVTDTATI